MAKPLLGGSAAMLALLSASLILYAQPSVAETLATASPESQTQDKRVSATATRTDTGGETVTPADSSVKNDTLTPSNTGGEGAASSPIGEAKKAEALVDNTTTAAGPPMSFTATAYSLRGRTASGKPVARGLIAADRRVLPIGTRVRLEAGSYSGEYTVADTGGAVRGRKIDIWMPSTREAMRFGRRPVKLTVLTRTRPRATGKVTQPAK